MNVPCSTASGPHADTLSFVLDESIGTARARIASWLRDRGAPVRRVDDVALAGSELMTNARWHGGGPIEVSCRMDDTAITLVVTNQAEPHQVPAPETWAWPEEPLARSGRGLGIVKAVADEAQVIRGDHWVAVETVFELDPTV